MKHDRLLRLLKKKHSNDAESERKAKIKESDERAAAFIEIMRANNVASVPLYRETTTITGHSSVESGEKFERYMKKVPTYKATASEAGRGWVIRPFLPSRVASDPYDGGGQRRQIGLFLLEDKQTFLYETTDRDVIYRAPSYDDSPRREMLEEAPYAGEVGLALLGNVIDKYGISSPIESSAKASG